MGDIAIYAILIGAALLFIFVILAIVTDFPDNDYFDSYLGEDPFKDNDDLR